MSRARIKPGLGGLATAIGWSLAFAIFVLAVSLALSWVIAAVWTGGLGNGASWLAVPGPSQIVVQGLALLGGGLAGTWVIGRRALGLDWEALRWRGTGSRSRGFLIGAGLGVAAALAALVLAVLTGGARWVDDAGTGWDYAIRAIETGAVLAPAALSEEIVFRGVPLVAVAMAVGRGPAVLGLAVVFGLAHAMNPEVSVQGIANVALAGVFLALAFYAPGGIWTAFGAHLGWNLALAISGAAVSGVPFEIPAVDFEAGGPAWLTGGGFGPEGGLLATVSLGAAIVATRQWIRRSAQ